MRKKRTYLLIDNPFVLVARNTSQAIVTATTTVVQWNTLIQEYGLTFDLTNFRFDVPATGIYKVIMSVFWGSNTTGDRWMDVNDNIVGQIGGQWNDAPTSVVHLHAFNMISILNLVAGRQINTRVFHTAGVNVNIGGGAVNFTRLYIEQVKILG